MISCCTSLICLQAAVSCRLARHLLVCRNYSSWELIYSRLWHWVDLSHIAKIIFAVEMFARHILPQTRGGVSASRTLQTKSEWVWIKSQVWLKVSYVLNQSHVKPGNKWIIRSDSTADHALFTSNYGRRGVGEAPIWATSYKFSNDILKQDVLSGSSSWVYLNPHHYHRVCHPHPICQMSPQPWVVIVDVCNMEKSFDLVIELLQSIHWWVWLISSFMFNIIWWHAKAVFMCGHPTETRAGNNSKW